MLGMKTVKLEFQKDAEGRFVADIVLPGRINVYVKLKKQGTVKAYAVVEGISKPVEVGTSDYVVAPVLDICLIAGTTIRLRSWNEVEEAAYIMEGE